MLARLPLIDGWVAEPDMVALLRWDSVDVALPTPLNPLAGGAVAELLARAAPDVEGERRRGPEARSERIRVEGASRAIEKLGTAGAEGAGVVRLLRDCRDIAAI